MSENMEISIAQKHDHITQMFDYQILPQGI